MKINQVIGVVLISLALFSWVKDGGIPVIPAPPIVDIVAPFPADKPTVLIVEEVNERLRLPGGQRDCLTSLAVRRAMDNAGIDYRVWDQHIDASHESEKWQAALSVDRESLPWIVASNGKSGFSQPLPNSPEELLELLKGL